MYKKLTLKDIEILHEGKQKEKAVLEKFNTIEAFASDVNMSLGSLNVYFHSKPYGSSKFNSILTLALDRDYNDIVLSDIEQVKRLVKNIWENIKGYKDKKDIEALIKLKELCIKYDMEKELSQVYRLISKHYHLTYKDHIAMEYINMAIDKINKFNDYSLLIIYYTDLFSVCYHNNDFDAAKKAYKEADYIFKKILLNDNSILFNYYYRLGVLFIREEPGFSRLLFEKSLKHAQESYEFGASTSNIGNTYQYQNRYDVAINYFYQALELYDISDTKRISSVYDNLANAYYLTNNIDKAKEFNSLSFKTLNDNDIDFYYAFLHTYAKINYRDNKSEAIKSLIKYLESSLNLIHNKSYIIESIKEIIELASRDNNCEFIYKLADIIEMYIDKHLEDEEDFDNGFRENLVKCIGELYLLIRKINKRGD